MGRRGKKRRESLILFPYICYSLIGANIKIIVDEV
jgi:hypothetical protein